MGKYHITVLHIIVIFQDIIESYHIIKLYNEYKKVVHKLYSSCMSSIRGLH